VALVKYTEHVKKIKKKIKPYNLSAKSELSWLTNEEITSARIIGKRDKLLYTSK
jgi:hypothetical protein